MSQSNELKLAPSMSVPEDKAGKQAFWDNEVLQWKKSGQSQSRYSRERGLVFHQLNYWVSKLGRSTGSTKKGLGQFVPIQVALGKEKEWIRIKRSDGLLIEFPLLNDMTYLKYLLEVLAC